MSRLGRPEYSPSGRSDAGPVRSQCTSRRRSRPARSRPTGLDPLGARRLRCRCLGGGGPDRSRDRGFLEYLPIGMVDGRTPNASYSSRWPFVGHRCHRGRRSRRPGRRTPAQRACAASARWGDAAVRLRIAGRGPRHLPEPSIVGRVLVAPRPTPRLPTCSSRLEELGDVEEVVREGLGRDLVAGLEHDALGITGSARRAQYDQPFVLDIGDP